MALQLASTRMRNLKQKPTGECSYFQANILFIPSILAYKNREDQVIFVISPPRNKQGRFRSVAEYQTMQTLPSDVLEGLVVRLLGYGC